MKNKRKIMLIKYSKTLELRKKYLNLCNKYILILIENKIYFFKCYKNICITKMYTYHFEVLKCFSQPKNKNIYINIVMTYF